MNWLRQLLCSHVWKYVGYAALFEYDRYECVKCHKKQTFSMFRPPENVLHEY